MKKFVQYLGVLLLAVFAVSPATTFAATFNNDPADFPTFQVKNATTNGGIGGYSSSAVANAGDTVNFLINIHNTDTVNAAANTRAFMNVVQGVAQSSFVVNGGASANNTGAVGNSVTLTINGGAQTLTLIPGSFKLFTTKAAILGNTPTFAPINGQPETQLLAASAASGMNIGSIPAAPANGDTFQYQTAITMQFRVGNVQNNVVNNPTVSTNALPSGANCTDATLSGFLNANGNTSTTVFFEYGTNSNLAGASQTGTQTFGNTSTNFSQFVSGLSQNTTYYYRANARGTNGVTVQAPNIVQFTTPSCGGSSSSNVPSVQTLQPTNVNFTDATLNGFESSNGNSTVTTYFEYGPAFAPFGQRTASTNFGNTSTNFSQFVSGLLPNTQYTYRAVAIGTNGQPQYGNPVTFTTGQSGSIFNPFPPQQFLPASVQTLPATGVSFDSAVLNGAMTSPVAFAPTVWFEYGPVPPGISPVGYNGALGSQTIPQQLGPVSNFSRIVVGLSPNTTYFFRAVANVNGQVVRGQTLAFTTGFQTIAPAVVTPAAVPASGFSRVTITKDGVDLSFPNGAKDCFAARPTDVLEFTITLKNGSSVNPASNLTVRDTLSPYFDFLGASQGGTLQGGDVIWSLGTLAAGETRTLAFQVRVRPVAGNTTFQNIASISNGTQSKSSNTVNVILLNTPVQGAASFAPAGQPGSAVTTGDAQTAALGQAIASDTASTGGLSGFFPKTALGWLGLLILLILVALLVRALV